MNVMRCSRILPLAASALVLAAQETGPVAAEAKPAAGVEESQPKAGAGKTPAAYILGPDDQIAVWSSDLGELSGKPLTIDMSGNLKLPLAGRVHAGGLTAQQLDAEIVARLREYVREPQVIVAVVELRSQPVSVLGEVNQPGIHQLQGRKTLVEILSLAGGPRPDAGHMVKITRSLEWDAIPLPGARNDPTGRFSIAEVSLTSIMTAKNPEENILIKPRDVISVPKADLVYVIGEVVKAGGFVLEGRETMSVLQALTLAGGLSRDAAPQSARILRESEKGETRSEIPVDVKKILGGQKLDIPLKSADILFIPSSMSKKATLRVAETALQAMTGIAIWRVSHY